MNVAMLKTLVAIVDRGSFAAAAREVGCTPSAVSLQVKQLEEFFGRPLFDRSTRLPRPTEFAVEIANAATDFSNRIDRLRLNLARTIEGRFRLGVITSMQSDLLPPALRLLHERHPALDVKVPPLNDTDELLTELRAGRIDAALLVRPENGGSSRMSWLELKRQPYVMLAPAEAQETTPRALLAAHDWIAYDTSLSGGRVAARYVRMLMPTLNASQEFRSVDAIVSMVSLGLGVTVVPQPRQPLLEAYGLKVIPLGRQAPFRRIAMVWRRADDDNRLVSEVVAAFKDIQASDVP
jgi:DNA-binding transcriptional LysR family regulator